MTSKSSLGSTSLADGHGLKAYAYLLDFDHAAANSSRTLGFDGCSTM